MLIVLRPFRSAKHAPPQFQAQFIARSYRSAQSEEQSAPKPSTARFIAHYQGLQYLQTLGQTSCSIANAFSQGHLNNCVSSPRICGDRKFRRCVLVFFQSPILINPTRLHQLRLFHAPQSLYAQILSHIPCRGCHLILKMRREHEILSSCCQSSGGNVFYYSSSSPIHEQALLSPKADRSVTARRSGSIYPSNSWLSSTDINLPQVTSIQASPGAETTVNTPCLSACSSRSSGCFLGRSSMANDFS